MAERIISQRVVSTKVLGSANPVARGFRNIKSSITGVCIAPVLLVLAIGALYYSEKFERTSKVVEALPVTIAADATGESGMKKISGIPTIITAANRTEIGDVLYYKYTKQHYEEVEKKETETETTVENGEEVQKESETIKLVEEWVDKENATKWADFKLGEITITPANASLQFNTTKKYYMPDPAQTTVNLAQICQANSGTWLSQYSECERMTSPVCTVYQGTYNACASPCRHETNTATCIQSCVELCTFAGTDTGKYIEIPSEDSVTPKLGDYRIIIEYVPKDASLIVVGEISSNSIASGHPFIISNKTDAELLSDLKENENITFWALKGLSWLLLTLGFASLFGPILTLLEFIPIAGKSLSCLVMIVGGFLALLFVVLGTVLIRFWWVFIVLTAILLVVGVVLLIMLIMKKRKQ